MQARDLFDYPRHRPDLAPAKFLPTTRARWTCSAGMLRHHPRDRRRVRRPSELRHGARRPAARSARLPRRHPRSARLAVSAEPSARSARRSCSSASPPATWIRWSTATRRSQDSLRRCVHARWRGGCARSRGARLRAALPRSVQRRADRDRRHRGEPAPHRALRLLVGQGAPLDPRRCASADLLVYGNAERAIVEIAHRLAAGAPSTQIRDVRGTAFVRRATPAKA